ncbi:SH3 domain-containing protein [Flavobacterium sp. N502536]|uniref:SH3 domain-containing protein n=1 Tax=Flavobacterium sp. N502536 TaxID=2986837 RepID=UPI002222E18E|nr:SH3 domain-containing protein [Flavobacterium sp. N502536]
MMKVFKILETYKTQYENPIILKTGETVKLGEEEKEEKWKGWIWAENEVNKGWVPLQILEISLDKKEAKVLEYYTAKELNVDKDDEIVKIKSLNGWTWVRKIVNNAEGWIPDEIIG